MLTSTEVLSYWTIWATAGTILGLLQGYGILEGGYGNDATVGPAWRCGGTLPFLGIWFVLTCILISQTVQYRTLRRLNGSNWRTEKNHSDSETRGGASNVGGASGDTGTRTPTIATSSGLEVIQQQEPIKAWRNLKLLANGFSVYLSPLNTQFGAFRADEQKAQCHAYQMYYGILGSKRPDPHDAPGLKCDCGFYAVKERTSVQPGGVLAEVDLYGTVIEHELGYRAEYQRVLSLRISQQYCMGAFLCEGKPGLLAFLPDQTVSSLSYGGLGSPAMPITQSGSLDPVPVCAKCAPKFDRVAALGQIAARLGVEVRWDDV